jgi:hypothetical protein
MYVKIFSAVSNHRICPPPPPPLLSQEWKWEAEISSKIALQVQIKSLVPLLFLMKIEALRSGEDIGKEAEGRRRDAIFLLVG